MMHDVLIGVLSALTMFTGWYVWWTRRRFNEYKRVLRTLVERAEADRENVRHARDHMDQCHKEWAEDHVRITDLGLTVGQVQAHVAALRETIRNPPPEPPLDQGPRQMQGQQAYKLDRPTERTAWVVILEDIDRL